MEKSFEGICRALGANILEGPALSAFFENTPWADKNADYSRVGVVGRLSVWEESFEEGGVTGNIYLLLGLDDDSPLQFFPDQ